MVVVVVYKSRATRLRHLVVSIKPWQNASWTSVWNIGSAAGQWSLIKWRNRQIRQRDKSWRSFRRCPNYTNHRSSNRKEKDPKKYSHSALQTWHTVCSKITLVIKARIRPKAFYMMLESQHSWKCGSIHSSSDLSYDTIQVHWLAVTTLESYRNRRSSLHGCGIMSNQFVLHLVGYTDGETNSIRW